MSLRGARHQPSDAGAKGYYSRCEERGISRATRQSWLSHWVTEGRDCFAGWLAMTENLLARNDTRGRDCFACWLAMTDERWLAMTERLSSLRGARHQPSDEAISPLCHSDPLRHSRENGNLIIVLRYIYAFLIICKNSLADSEALPTNAPLICSQIVNSRIFFALTDPP